MGEGEGGEEEEEEEKDLTVLSGCWLKLFGKLGLLLRPREQLLLGSDYWKTAKTLP